MKQDADLVMARAKRDTPPNELFAFPPHCFPVCLPSVELSVVIKGHSGCLESALISVPMEKRRGRVLFNFPSVLLRASYERRSVEEGL